MSVELAASFTAKLEPFLLMAKSAKGAAAAKLVEDATLASGVFVFAELLDQPNIKELATNEQHASFYSLLQLFSYKTYQDYLQHKDVLPPLKPPQLTKLKHLSLVTLATDRRILPYSTLLQALDMPTIRELEDLIIDAIYMDIIRGKLDQKEQQFEVEYTMGRDLEPGKVEGILATLQEWASTTASVLATLDNKLASLSARAAANQAEEEEYDKTVQKILQEVSDKHKESKAGGKKNLPMAMMEKTNAMDNMDVDEPVENVRTKNRNRAPTDLGAKPQRKRNRF